jgi:hypothetical protein
MNQQSITEAAKKLETAELTFDHLEGEFFAGKITADALRTAYDERETARQALQRAHLAAA